MTHVGALCNRGPLTPAFSQEGLDFRFVHGGRNFGHADILVNHYYAVKEQITRPLSDPQRVSEKSAETISEIVAFNLDALMRQSKLTQPALAQKAGVSQKTISNYLNPRQRDTGKSGKAPSPKLEELSKIADALHVPMWRIVRKWNPRELRFYERMERLWEEMGEEERKP